jgi:thymidylate synthase (FAD)
MPDLHYLPAPERIQVQSTANKQGSAESVSAAYADGVLRAFRDQQHDVYDYYNTLVEGGIAKEVARLNTPVSRYSKMRAKTDLRNWLAFLQLRMAPNAQWEIRQYAYAVAAIVADLFPRTWALFEEHTLYSVRLSRREAAELRAHLTSGGTLSNALTAKLLK